jgi:mono/diheme cytochrome c family protein
MRLPERLPSGSGNKREGWMTWGRVLAVASGTAAAVAAMLAVDLSARQEPTKAADGMFTEAQATRGQLSYSKNCASCHLEDLRGEGFAPALVDRPFDDRWGYGSVGELFVSVQGTMPADRPKSLPAAEYADIVAYLLKANGYPAGQTELSHDANALKALSMKKAAK